MIEEKEVVAHLYTSDGRVYPLLEIKPQIHYVLPATLREHVLVFLVLISGEEYWNAHNIIVGRGGFHIVPLLSPVKYDVEFIIEDEEDEQEKFSLLTPVSDSVE